MKVPGLLFRPSFKENNGNIHQYQTEGSACFDIFADEHYTLKPMERHLFKTGLYLDGTEYSTVILLQFEEYFNDKKYSDIFVPELLIRPRSGLAVKFGIQTMAGEVDCDYRQEIRVLLINFGDELYDIKAGDRIAQARWNLSLRPASIQVKKEVRQGGFSSTGV